MIRLTVQRPNQRLDRFITDQLSHPRSVVQYWFQNDGVLVNNHPKKPSYKVKIGDQITINDQSPPSVQPSVKARMLYEDEAIIILEKPVDLIVHPPANHQTLVDQLKAEKRALAPAAGIGREGIVHRLDRYTSGVMVIAKTDAAYHHLQTQFKTHTVTKYYVAMVKGDIVEDEITIDQPILKTAAMKKGTIHPDGKPSTTIISVVKRFRTKTLIKVRMITGRTHQIRIHLASKGHPLIGDGIYGKANQSTNGPLLQAVSLAFDHPITGQRLQMNIPLRKEFLND